MILFVAPMNLNVKRYTRYRTDTIALITDVIYVFIVIES